MLAALLKGVFPLKNHVWFLKEPSSKEFSRRICEIGPINVFDRNAMTVKPLPYSVLVSEQRSGK